MIDLDFQNLLLYEPYNEQFEQNGYDDFEQEQLRQCGEIRSLQNLSEINHRNWEERPEDYR